MNFESPNHSESAEASSTPEARERREYDIYKDIQNELIVRTIKQGEDLSEHMMNWATGQDAVKFADAFEGLKAENSKLLDDYEKDPEEVIAAIQARMNQLPSSLKRAA